MIAYWAPARNVISDIMLLETNVYILLPLAYLKTANYLQRKERKERKEKDRKIKKQYVSIKQLYKIQLLDNVIWEKTENSKIVVTHSNYISFNFVTNSKEKNNTHLLDHIRQ